jgi:alkanesulfonate monooxygenase SsuD/methylene tetrahydromethanopterin reductase-like flavin-dependent oxidoreductase (luciferase family)
MAKPKFYTMLPQRNFAKTRALAEAGDALGYYGVGLSDHLICASGRHAIARRATAGKLGAVAAVTNRIMKTQVVGANSFRNPALLAKITSTLDNISGGRFELGIAAGWLREEY